MTSRCKEWGYNIEISGRVSHFSSEVLYQCCLIVADYTTYVVQQSYQESVLVVTWIYNTAGQSARSKARCSPLQVVYKVLIRFRERGHGWKAEINTGQRRRHIAAMPPLHIVYVQRSTTDLVFAELWAAVHIMALGRKKTKKTKQTFLVFYNEPGFSYIVH